MVTQMSIARRGIATEEMVQVAKDEDVDLGFLAMTRETGKRLPVYDR
jgi:thiamine biosynthesis protein ThiC